MSAIRAQGRPWRRRALGAALGIGWLASPNPSPAQPTVVFDGSLGAAGPAPTEPLPGGGLDHRIDAVRGRQVDAALFHSFAEFGIRTGDAATFTGPGTIDHVFARVTGGEASQIDGRLRSEIGSADLWLVNPRGVLFGKDAQLEVDGSFHASTAHELRFANGESFQARPGGAVPTLVVAPPSAFGFLDGDPAPLSVEGRLAVPAGETLSLVGRDGIALVGAQLSAPGGRVELEAPGAVALVRSTVDVGGVAPGAVAIRAGRLVMEQRSQVLAENESALPGPPDEAGPGAISVVATESVLVDDSLLSVSTHAAGNAGTIQVESPSVTFQNGPGIVDEDAPQESEAGARAETISTGAAGAIRIEAGDLIIRDGVNVSATAIGSLAGEVRGDGGTVEIVAHSVEVSDRSYISSSSWGSLSDAGVITIELTDHGSLLVDARAQAHGGDETPYAWIIGSSYGTPGTIEIEGGRVEIRDGAGIVIGCNGACASTFADRPEDAATLRIRAEDLLVDGGTLSAQTVAPGDGGRIIVDADRVAIGSGGTLAASTFARGDGGRIIVAADQVAVGSGGAIAAAATEGAGDAGSIEIGAGSFAIRPGGAINVSSLGSGNAGAIEIRASESIFLTDTGGERFRLLPILLGPPFSLTGIFSGTGGGGDGGSIALEAPDLFVTDGAIVATSTLGGGAGGRIELRGERIHIANGAFIDTTSLPGADGRAGGAAGRIAIEASESITVMGRGAYGDGARVASATFGPGAAGDVSLSAPLVRIDDGGSVATTTLASDLVEAASSAGAAGRIDVDAAQLVVGPGGQIDSSSLTAGAAGDAALRARDSIAISGAGSRVATRAGGEGAGGRISLVAPKITILDGGEISSDSAPGLGSVADVFASFVAEGIVAAPPAAATGEGGSIELSADSLRMQGGAIGARAAGNADAGSIGIRAGQQVELVDSAISSEATERAGGDIAITAHAGLRLVRSAITASVTDGSGGNVVIDPQLVLLEDGSRIAAEATRGSGGNIALAADVLLVSPDSMISASSALGIQGTVEIHAPDTNLAGELAPLPESFLDAVALMKERCAARRTGERAGSFVWTGRHGAPGSPDGPLAAFYETVERVAAANPELVGALLVEGTDLEPVALLVGCG